VTDVCLVVQLEKLADGKMDWGTRQYIVTDPEMGRGCWSRVFDDRTDRDRNRLTGALNKCAAPALPRCCVALTVCRL
jgi:hypothetical protein